MFGRFTIHVLLLFAALTNGAHAQTWTPIANEGQPFTVPASSIVRYGADTRWIERELPSGGAGQCTNAWFGSDPAVGIKKACQINPIVPVPTPAPPAPVPACWPTQVGGAGTPARMVVIAPAGTAPKTAEPVHVLWWYCASSLEPSGWRSTHLMCPQSKLTQCLLGVPMLNPAALAAAWQASPPRPAGDADIGWAQTAWREQHDKPPPAPPAQTWVVAKAASNANPPGTRPAFIAIKGELTALYHTERVREGEPCDCNKASVQRGATRYCQVGTRDDKVAVCVKR
jgi:hypothetical protein